MEGRWTIAYVGYNEWRVDGPLPTTDPTPVVPCDDAAIERAVHAIAGVVSPGYRRAVAEAVLRAAGDAS